MLGALHQSTALNPKNLASSFKKFDWLPPWTHDPLAHPWPLSRKLIQLVLALFAPRQVSRVYIGMDCLPQYGIDCVQSCVGSFPKTANSPLSGTTREQGAILTQGGRIGQSFEWNFDVYRCHKQQRKGHKDGHGVFEYLTWEELLACPRSSGPGAYSALKPHAGLSPDLRTEPRKSLSCSIFKSYRSSALGAGPVRTSP